MMRFMLRLAVLSAAILIAGCAGLMRGGGHSDVPNSVWTGRLSLQVESDPPQNFSAMYELKGNPEEGELALFTPLGSTVAVLAWKPNGATLTAANKTSTFESLDDLAQHATGADVPVIALFGWLHGENSDATATGWRADLSQLESGRLLARRTHFGPDATLRMVIDR